jgi:hypothetical protein
MRFLLVSDLHYALQHYDWIAGVAPEFDAVVIAGDHLDGHSSVDGNAQIAVLLKSFSGAKPGGGVSHVPRRAPIGRHGCDGRSHQSTRNDPFCAQIAPSPAGHGRGGGSDSADRI